MGRIQIPVALQEFDEGGRAIWVHSPKGATVLRIKTAAPITVNRGCENIVSHSDIEGAGNVEFCLADDAEAD